MAVGSAELSSIELKGVFIHLGIDDDDRYICDAMLPLYATNVVTSKAHPRLGIGSILMNHVARTAWEMGSGILLLHVEYNNTPARTFYEQIMGYNEFTEIKQGDSANARETRIVSFVLKDRGSQVGTCGRNDPTVFIDPSRLAFNADRPGTPDETAVGTAFFSRSGRRPCPQNCIKRKVVTAKRRFCVCSTLTKG